MHANHRGGFSLVELLVVITLILFLSGLSAFSLKGTSAARLANAGASISGFIESARENAILKRQPVAVAMLVSGEDANRAFTALGYVPPASGQTNGSWKQISRWELLPQGVTVDLGADSAGNALTGLLPSGSPPVGTALPSLVRKGATYAASDPSGYGYVVFMPDGSLFQNANGSTPPVLRLIEGNWQEGSIQYTGGKDDNGNTANYVEISINQATGKVKIIRPQ